LFFEKIETSLFTSRPPPLRLPQGWDVALTAEFEARNAEANLDNLTARGREIVAEASAPLRLEPSALVAAAHAAPAATFLGHIRHPFMRRQVQLTIGIPAHGSLEVLSKFDRGDTVKLRALLEAVRGS